MKPRFSPVLFFVILNGLLLTICTSLYWLQAGRELINNFSVLKLQEQRYERKEQNFINMEINQQLYEEIKAELTDSEIILLPYSSLLVELAKIKTMVEINSLTETAFFVDEPIIFDTSVNTVAILDVTASYKGDYDNLYAMTLDLFNSACHIRELNVSKKDSVMSVSFSLYGIME